MLYILLPVHNRKQVTVEFMHCLQAQSHQQYTLILIDDGSIDGTAQAIRAMANPDKLVILTGNGNLWWAGALQFGYEFLNRQGLTHHDAVMIINDDVSFDEHFLAKGLQHLQQDPQLWIQAVAVDSVTGHYDRGVYIDFWHLKYYFDNEQGKVNCLSTRGLLMSADSFVHSAGFYPKLLPHYASDYEFTIRGARQGAKLACFDDFQLQMNSDTSGYHHYAHETPLSFLKKAFSNKASFNPVRITIFVIMVCPPLTVPILMIRVWGSFIKRLAIVITQNWSGHHEVI